MSGVPVCFRLKPFYCHMDNGQIYNIGNTTVKITMTRKELLDIIDISVGVLKLYEPRSYKAATTTTTTTTTPKDRNGASRDDFTLSAMKQHVRPKIHNLWNKITTIVESNESLRKVTNAILIDNVDSIENTLNYIYSCVILQKICAGEANDENDANKINTPAPSSPSSLKCDEFYDLISHESYNNDNVLATTMEHLWTLLDDILFFKPIYSILQNLLVFYIQIYILSNNSISFEEGTPSVTKDITTADALGNRMGCFIKQWLLQGKDTSVRNIYTCVLNDDIFHDLAKQLRKYILHNRDRYNVLIGRDNFVSEEVFTNTLLNDKKGLYRNMDDLSIFVRNHLNSVISRKINDDNNDNGSDSSSSGGSNTTTTRLVEDIQTDVLIPWLLFEGFCGAPSSSSSFYDRHLSVLKSHSLLHLKNISDKDNGNLVNKCFEIIMADSLVVNDTIKSWIENKYILALQEVYEMKKYITKVLETDKTCTMKNKKFSK